MLVNTLLVLLFSYVLLQYAQAPRCVECSSKLRHREDCPRR